MHMPCALGRAPPKENCRVRGGAYHYCSSLEIHQQPLRRHFPAGLHAAGLGGPFLLLLGAFWGRLPFHQHLPVTLATCYLLTLAACSPSSPGGRRLRLHAAQCSMLPQTGKDATHAAHLFLH